MLAKGSFNCWIYNGCTGLFASKRAPTMGSEQLFRIFGVHKICGSELAHERIVQLLDI